ncbi:chlorophyll synthesis pathway protein BchC [Limnohabitans sp. B9-3]|uniref:chlorophyll synthesis pathway protein BchC n=1 Tax=Limnohabitans sp. B9-3 TaxID=1100707 RepID=UPI000C1EFA90|nr:chlorophyll synthesis pathway protein BchC [Limnohabitans sp. B9-3]PIT73701.1 chlorophyll synthesis pathway protein BchC [Limnohabitans sp. B9-3]
MKSTAVVFDRPKQLSLQALELPEVKAGQLEVAVQYSGISTGAERMLWDGSMPALPGLAYPLVPGFETFGQVVKAHKGAKLKEGDMVFVPGANCFSGVKSLYGGAASRLVVSDDLVLPVSNQLGVDAVMLALAATAYHAVSGGGVGEPFTPPDLIIGHGVMGRLLARLTVAAGFPAPTVWESRPEVAKGAQGYDVIRPEDDPRKDYQAIYDVNGDAGVLDDLIQRIRPGGEVVLAGFYKHGLQFSYSPAFNREARIRIASEWKRADLLAVNELVNNGQLSLKGLVTHVQAFHSANAAYETAFGDVSCLKMVLDWSAHA